jgi:hypothetical protein
MGQLIFFIFLLTGFTLISITSGMNKMPPVEVKAYPGFGRACPSGQDGDCLFQPDVVSLNSSSSPVYMKCKKGTEFFCTCGSSSSIPERELMWPLEWEVSSSKCLVGKGAPCGQDKDLTLHCKTPFECLQGRCRNSTEIHLGGENAFCGDDLDCKEGLKCMESRVPTAVKTRRCYTPQ